jgi:hypothetical protein
MLPFFDDLTYLYVDIFIPERGQKWAFLDHLPLISYKFLVDILWQLKCIKKGIL